MRFSGHVPYTVDDRGRVPIPPQFRDAFKAGGYIGAAPDGCLLLYTNEEFERQAAIIDALPDGDPVAEEARRDFYANFWPIQLDSQGRISLRDDLAARAGIRRSSPGTGDDAASRVTVAGVGRRVEIWNTETWIQREAARKEARQLVRPATGAAMPPAGGA